MWAMSLITYFRCICNSLKVTGKPLVGGEEDGSKWSHTPFPVPGHILSCRDLFIWRSSPFLVLFCVEPGLLTGALWTSGKRRLSGLSDTPGKKRRVQISPRGCHLDCIGCQQTFSCNAIFSHFFLWFCFESEYGSTAHGAFHSWPLLTINTRPDG